MDKQRKQWNSYGKVMEKLWKRQGSNGKEVNPFNTSGTSAMIIGNPGKSNGTRWKATEGALVRQITHLRQKTLNNRKATDTTIEINGKAMDNQKKTML